MVARTPPLCRRSRGQGFAKACGRGEEQQRTDNGKDDKDTVPGGEAKQQPTEDRGKDWRETVHKHEQREEPGGSDAGMQVAHDGTRDDDTGSTGKALYEAEHDKSIRRGCDRAQE